VRATGHPDAEKLARVVAGFVASGAPRSIDQGVQLKMMLKYSKSPIWRSVQLCRVLDGDHELLGAVPRPAR